MLLVGLASGKVAGMAVQGSNPVVGGTNLARAQINSPNYVAGSTGWAIKQDGSAEFNNVTIRGGTTIGGTALYYSTPTPQANTLVASVGASGGTDSAGNVYLAGVVTYFHGAGIYFALQHHAGEFDAYTATTEAGPWSLVQSLSFSTLINSVYSLVPSAPIVSSGGTASAPTVITTDSWNQISPGGTWTNSGSGVNGFFYTLLPDNTVALAWDVSNNNANPGTLGTLPAAYRPATTVRLQSGWGGTGPTSYNDQFSPMIQVASNGNITGGGLFVATLTLFGTAIFPLGSL